MTSLLSGHPLQSTAWPRLHSQPVAAGFTPPAFHPAPAPLLPSDVFDPYVVVFEPNVISIQWGEELTVRWSVSDDSAIVTNSVQVYQAGDCGTGPAWLDIDVLLAGTTDSYDVGDTLSVQWTATDASAIELHSVQIYESGTCGQGDVGLVMDVDVQVPGIARTYNWSLPSSLAGGTYKVKVATKDEHDNWGLDCSSSFSVASAASIDLTPECPSYSSCASFSCGGGVVMKVCGTVDSSGWVTVKAQKTQTGGTFGDGDYRVRVFDPNDVPGDRCVEGNFVKRTMSVSGSPSTITFPAFDSLASPGDEKVYCVTEDDAFWCSGQLDLEY